MYATSLIMFALPIFMPPFRSIFFYQNSPKIKLFLPKNAKFLSAGGSAPIPPNQPPHSKFLPSCLTLSHIFEKKDFLWDKDTVEWRIRSRGLHELTSNLDFAKGKDLNQKLKIFQNCLKLRDVVSKLV